jgi:hypothetical protein
VLAFSQQTLENAQNIFKGGDQQDSTDHHILPKVKGSENAEEAVHVVLLPAWGDCAFRLEMLGLALAPLCFRGLEGETNKAGHNCTPDVARTALCAG